MSDKAMTDEKAAGEYADNLYRNAGCSPNTDGRWTVHRTDFLAGATHVRQELRDAKIAAARRGAELARDDVYRIKEPTLETGGLSEVEYKHSIDEVLDVYTKELDGDE